MQNKRRDAGPFHLIETTDGITEKRTAFCKTKTDDICDPLGFCPASQSKSFCQKESDPVEVAEYQKDRLAGPIPACCAIEIDYSIVEGKIEQIQSSVAAPP